LEAFRANQVKNGQDLLALKDDSPRTSPVAHIDALSGTQEYYAPVTYPRGRPIRKIDRVPDGNAIPDLNGNKVCDADEVAAYLAANPQLNGQPPMVERETWNIDNTFVDRLKGALLDDAAADALYAEMQAAVDEINTSGASSKYTADLSARPPSFAQMEHAIILQAQGGAAGKDPRLDIRLSDALKESLKWVEVPGPENGESGEVAPVAVAVGLSYSMKWLCFCKENAETEDEVSREGKSSANGAGIAR
jgi:hypothetical protein